MRRRFDITMKWEDDGVMCKSRARECKKLCNILHSYVGSFTFHRFHNMTTKLLSSLFLIVVMKLGRNVCCDLTCPLIFDDSDLISQAIIVHLGGRGR